MAEQIIPCSSCSGTGWTPYQQRCGACRGLRSVRLSVSPPEFKEASWGVDSVMRQCTSMAVSEYAFREWAKANGITLSAYGAPASSHQTASRTDAPAQAELDAGSKCQPDGLMFDAFCNPRVRYVRVSFDGSHLILSTAEAAEWKREAEAAAASIGQTDPHTYSNVYLSEVEADALPEFDGF